jgi:hypothetical protein
MAIHETTIHPFLAQGRTATSTRLLDPRNFAGEVSVVALECRQAILTNYLPDDELIGRLRSSIVIAHARRSTNVGGPLFPTIQPTK